MADKAVAAIPDDATIAGMFFLGLFANPALNATARAVTVLKAPGTVINVETQPSVARE